MYAPTWRLLGYLGLVPFVFFLLLSLLNNDVFFAVPKQGFIFYSAIILSFLAGTLWQPHRHEGETKQNVNTEGADKQNITSNVFSLLAFFALFIEHDIALVLLAFGYISLYFYERKYIRANHQIAPYYRMRLKLTLIVFLMHVMMFIF